MKDDRFSDVEKEKVMREIMGGVEPAHNGKDHTALSAEEILNSAGTLPPCHPAMTWHGGVLYLGMRAGETALWVNSRRELLTPDSMATRFRDVRLPANPKLTAETVKAYRAGATVSVPALIENMEKELAPVVFAHEWQRLLIVVWIIATYLHRLFPIFPYLWVHSPTRRCGKSLLFDVLAGSAFNCTPVVDPSPAIVYRDVALNASTLIIDEADNLGEGDRDKQGQLFSILNAGFKRGTTIPRISPSDKSTPEYFEPYSPKALAGLREINSTLRDRSLKIELARKRKRDQPPRLNPDFGEAGGAALRHNLYLFALHHAGDVAELYSHASSLPIPTGVDDRLRDCLESLFSVAGVLDTLSGGLVLTPRLIEAANALAGIRATDEQEDEAICQAVRVLVEAMGKEESLLWRSEEARTHFYDGGLEWVKENRHATHLLNQLDFYSGTHRIEGKPQRRYEIRRDQVTNLAERYLPAHSPVTPVTTLTAQQEATVSMSVTPPPVTGQPNV